MKAKVSMRQATPDDGLTMHWKLTVRRAKNDVDTYTQLDSGMYLQTFFQIRNPFQSDQFGQDYYENYVGTIWYVPADLG